MPIAFYSDSFGWGHLTRDAAFIRAWADLHQKDRLFWKVGSQAEPIAARLAQGRKNVAVITWEGSMPLAARGLGCDPGKTGWNLKRWTTDEPARVRREAEFLKKNEVGLVLSDIAPDAFYAAKMADVPPAAVSNFSWMRVLEGMLPEAGDIQQHLAGAYEQAAISFILPFCGKCPELPRPIRTPMLVRKLEDGLVEAKKKALSGNFLRALAAFGKSAGTVRLPKLPDGWKAMPPLNDEDTEGQHAPLGADVVLAKASYGACSEAVQAGVPVLACERPFFSESRDVMRELRATGWGWNVEIGEMGDFLARWKERPRLRMKKIDFGGAEFILKKLEETRMGTGGRCV